VKLLQSSLDWQTARSDLLQKTTNLTHGREIRKMIENISVKVTELSKAEVAARRGRSNSAAELISQINEDIETVEGFLLVAALLG
jgi:hypothetical protein